MDMIEKIDFYKEKISMHNRINACIIELMQQAGVDLIKLDSDPNNSTYVVRAPQDIEEVKVRAIRNDDGMLFYQSDGYEGDEWNPMDTFSDIFLTFNVDMYEHVYDYIQELENKKQKK
jgi:hypothetical protein